MLGAENDLQGLGNSEISLKIDNANEDDIVSVDIREQIFDAIANLKEKLGLIGTR